MGAYQIKPANQEKLPVIRTARSLSAINKAAAAGWWPLVQPVVYNPVFREKFSVAQHPETGQIEVIGDYRSGFQAGFKTVIEWTDYCPVVPSCPFAAYLVPKDLPVGARVWLADLIEDFIGGEWNQGSVYRLGSAAATWTGTHFQIDPVDNYGTIMIG